MKTPVMLLVTQDPNLEESVAQALLQTGAVSHLMPSPSDALELVCTLGQNVDLAVVDCEHGPYGLNLLSTIKTRREEIPVIVVTGEDEKLVEALAYANGAFVCWSKPVLASQIAAVIKQCTRRFVEVG